MDLTAPIDIYCERLFAGVGEEPLNTISNIGFFIAAWLLFYRDNALDPAEKVLTVVMVAIGVGSTLFHLLGVRWAMIADIVPIMLFQLIAVGMMMTRLFGCNAKGVVGGIVGFLLLGAIFGQLTFLDEWMNGSQAYLPGLIVLLIASAKACHDKMPSARHFMLASGYFTVALFFRSIDMHTCSATTGVGTHMGWHLFNAPVLYYVVLGLCVLRKERAL